MNVPIEAVLFDLDGTLIDSAPDLAGAANDMRMARGMPALPYADLRRMVGTGARGMVGVALGKAPGDDGYDALRDEFLQRYQARMTEQTRIFDGVVELLSTLRAAGLACGVVTNKATWLAEPLVAALGLQAHTSTLVCGDTTPHSKPHPAPLLEAARRLGIAAEHCVYVGDDLRDVQAGHAAGMRTIGAAWGYLGDGEPIEAWGADRIIDAPFALPGALASLNPGLEFSGADVN